MKNSLKNNSTNFMLPALVQGLMGAMGASIEQLKQSIYDVKSAGFDPDFTEEWIYFSIKDNGFKGGKFIGALRKRNKDLCIGFGDESDKSIAARVLIDGDILKFDGF